jgi:hypothetical protein
MGQALMGIAYAQVRHRKRDFWCWKIVARPASSDLAEILRSAKESRTTDSVVESYVMDDRIYCVYIAPNEELIREHARQGGFPANRISEVRAIIDPTTAESQAQ